MSKGNSTLLVIIVVFALLASAGVLNIQGLNFGGTSSGGSTSGGYVPIQDGCEISTATLGVASVVYSNNTKISDSKGSHYVYMSSGRIVGTSSVIDAYPDSIASLPVNFNGFLVSGNGSTYYTVKTPISWGCVGTYDVPNDVKIPAIGAPTVTGYDDGTAESSFNVTVGTADITSSEVKLSAPTGACLGNPTLSRPIMVCVNGSASTLAYFKEIKPTGVAKSSYVPEFLTSGTSVLGCYELPIDAVCDGNNDRRFWTIDPISDPTSGMVVSLAYIDKDYYLDDQNTWQVGWEDKSSYVAAADIGATTTYTTLAFG